MKASSTPSLTLPPTNNNLDKVINGVTHVTTTVVRFVRNTKYERHPLASWLCQPQHQKSAIFYLRLKFTLDPFTRIFWTITHAF